jgi:Icc-related predicted phosphoesterase
MKILAIGDPHGDLKKIKKISLNGVDLILLTGDLGKADLARKRHFENIERVRQGLDKLDVDADWAKNVHDEIHYSTIEVLKYLSRFAPVYTIQGNVGIPTRAEVRKESKEYGIRLPVTREVVDRMKNVELVKNQLRNINGLRVGFLEIYTDVSWVKEFKPKRYNKKMNEAKKETEKARRTLERFGKLDILICHQPPYGYLDKVSGKFGAPKQWQGKHAGGKVILNYIHRHHPRYVFCGHIHEGEGHKKIGKTDVYNLGVGGHIFIEL